MDMDTLYKTQYLYICIYIFFCSVFQLLALVYLLWNKVRGIQTSCSLFIFYFLLTLAGVFEFRTSITNDIKGVRTYLYSNIEKLCLSTD